MSETAAHQGLPLPVATEGEILENRKVAPFTWIMKIHAPEVAPRIHAGQFVNLSTSTSIVPLLRRPMSVHKVVRHGGPATGFCVLYDVVGPGTTALSQMRPGQRIPYVGPLGNTITVPDGARRAVLVAGGIGAGPIKLVAETLQARGLRDITICYGARDGDHCVPVEDLAPHGCRVLVCTDDGSVGKRMRVTGHVEDLLQTGRLARGDYVFTCGPRPMFRALRDLLAPHGIPAEAATEEFMGCGFGVCNGCPLLQVQPDGRVDYKLCCLDGCLFPLDTLVFDGDGLAHGDVVPVGASGGGASAS
jgi:dihydroorotate dehydrogenase electron transfer subunit